MIMAMKDEAGRKMLFDTFVVHGFAGRCEQVGIFLPYIVKVVNRC